MLSVLVLTICTLMLFTRRTPLYFWMCGFGNIATHGAWRRCIHIVLRIDLVINLLVVIRFKVMKESRWKYILWYSVRNADGLMRSVLTVCTRSWLKCSDVWGEKLEVWPPPDEDKSTETVTLINLPPVGEDDEADGVADQPEDGEDGGQDPRDDPPAVFVLYTCYM